MRRRRGCVQHNPPELHPFTVGPAPVALLKCKLLPSILEVISLTFVFVLESSRPLGYLSDICWHHHQLTHLWPAGGQVGKEADLPHHQLYFSPLQVDQDQHHWCYALNNQSKTPPGLFLSMSATITGRSLSSLPSEQVSSLLVSEQGGKYILGKILAKHFSRYTIIAELCDDRARKYAFISGWVW